MRRAAQTGLARAEEKLGVVAHLAVPRVELLARVIARQQTIGLKIETVEQWVEHHLTRDAMALGLASEQARSAEIARALGVQNPRAEAVKGRYRDPATGCFAKRPAGLAKRGGSRAQAR